MMKHPIFCLLLIHRFHDTVAQTNSNVKWCTIATNEQLKCEGMQAAFASKNLSPALECVKGNDHADCVRKIDIGEADLIALDGGDIYTFGVQYGIKTIMAEVNSDGDGYYAVAVAKKSNMNINIKDLKGKRSCHTGVKKTAGWNVPVGYLLGKNLMDVVVGCNSDIKLAGAFFSQSCAPGALSSTYNPNGDNPASLCDQCIGEGNNKCVRSSAEPYYNYDGAFRCLVEDGGDVAFVKHKTVPSFTDRNSDKSWARGLNSADYVLLCPDGSKKDVLDYKYCNLAWVPSHAVVTSSLATMDEINTYRKLLSDAQLHFAVDGNTDFEMFDSTDYHETDLLFKDSTSSLENTTSTQYETYLGSDYLLTIKGLEMCPAGTARFCVFSDAEYIKCKDMKTAFAEKGLKPGISCRRALDKEDCMKKIKNDQADLVVLDGGDIVKAGSQYMMQPVAGENNTGDESTRYWAVAAAKKGTKFGFDDLNGKIGEYFNSSCAPGAMSPKDNENRTNPENLCELCIGKGVDKCSEAFRCLAEAAVDVAFVKLITVGDNTNGNNFDAWAVNFDKADFELLCPDGTRKPIDEWKTCNLARVPSHAVMTSGNKSVAEKKEYWNLLNNGQKIFSNDTGSRFRMFDSSNYVGTSLIFRDSTVNLVDVDEDTYQKWVGNEYFKAYTAVTCMDVGATDVGATDVGVKDVGVKDAGGTDVGGTDVGGRGAGGASHVTFSAIVVFASLIVSLFGSVF